MDLDGNNSRSSRTENYFSSVHITIQVLVTSTVLNVVRAAVPEVSTGPVTVAGSRHGVLDYTSSGPVNVI